MTIEERVRAAAHRVADDVEPPALDIDQVRRSAHTNRRRRIGIVAAVAATIAVCILVPRLLGTPTSAPEPSDQPPGPPNGYSLLPHEETEHLEPGRWAMQDADWPTPLAVIDVPSGFGGADWILWHGDSALAYWLVDRVYDDPCAAKGVAPRIGPTVEDLATALAAQKVTTTTDPVPVTIDGHTGLYLELTAPSDLDYEDCARDALYIWDTPTTPRGSRFIEEPGVDRYWIMDVDGQRIVLLTAVPTDETKATVDLLADMVESADFVDQD